MISIKDLKHYDLYTKLMSEIREPGTKRVIMYYPDEFVALLRSNEALQMEIDRLKSVEVNYASEIHLNMALQDKLKDLHKQLTEMGIPLVFPW